MDRASKATVDYQAPQFNRFLNKVGIVEKAYEREGVAREASRRETKELFESPENEASLEEFFDANPVLGDALIARREQKPLTAAEQKALNEAPTDAVEQFEMFEDYLDDADQRRIPALRDAGMEIGSLGETYFPRHADNVGDLIGVLGPQFKEAFLSPEGVFGGAGNLLESRLKGPTPKGTNPVRVHRSYRSQLNDLESRASLHRETQNLVEHWRHDKTRGAEADALENYARGAVAKQKSVTDIRWRNDVLRQIATEADVQPGLRIKSDGRWLPEGDIEVTREGNAGPQGRTFHLKINGVESPVARPETSILAQQFSKLSTEASPTWWVNQVGRLGSLLKVAGKWKTAAKTMGANIGRAWAADSIANLREGIKSAATASPERIQKYEDWGIVKKGAGAYSEGAFEGARNPLLARAEEIIHMNVTLPDNLVKPIIAEARIAGLLKEKYGGRAEAALSPKEQTALWRQAGMHTSKFGDMYADAFRSSAQNTPQGRAFYNLVSAPIREYTLILDNLRKRDFKAVAKQTGFKVAFIGATLGLVNNEESWLKAIISDIPVLGGALTRGEIFGWASAGIAAEEAYNLGVKPIVTGKPPGREVLPDFVKQVLPEKRGR